MSNQQIGLILLIIFLYDIYETTVLYIQIPTWLPDQIFNYLAGLPIFLLGWFLYHRGK